MSNAHAKLNALKAAFKAKFGRNVSEAVLKELIEQEIARYERKFLLDERLKFFSLDELRELSEGPKPIEPPVVVEQSQDLTPKKRGRPKLGTAVSFAAEPEDDGYERTIQPG